MKYFFLVLLLNILNIPSWPQEIKGKVSEEVQGKKQALAGVNIFWSGTSVGTTSDVSGHFSIPVPVSGKTSLIVSFIGYQTDTIKAGEIGRNLDIILTPNLELSEITVLGKQKGTRMDKMNPIQTTVISSAGLQQAACCNLAESFETSASVEVNYSDALTGAKQIMMLGLAGIYSQLMTENIPNMRGLGSTFGLSYIPGTWMESIQVSKGTSSVINGFESITGQINTEFKKPNTGEKLFLNVYGNDETKIEVNMNSSIHLNDQWSTIILGHMENLNKRIDMNHDGFLDLPLNRQYNIMNKWLYKGKKGLETRFGFNIIDDKRTAGEVNYSRENTNPADSIYGISMDTRRYEVYMKNGYIFQNRPATSIGLISSYTNHRQRSMFGYTGYSGTQNSLYTNLIFQSYIGNTFHSYSTGLSFVADDYREILGDSLFSRLEKIPGVFFQYTYQPGDRLTLMGGIRADYHNRYGFFYTPRIHIRFKPTESITVRASAGKGYRSANIIAENSYLLASSKKIKVLEKPGQEKAWNYGLNVLKSVPIADREMTLSVEYYRTDFQNQVVVDMEQDPSSIYIYNLDGKSYSNAWQFDLMYELLPGMDLTMGYRITDVKTTYHNQLMEKPLVNRYKGLVNASYTTPMHKWQFDFTWQINGPGRLTSVASNPLQYQREERFPSYHILNTQITKRFRYWDVYLGAENLTDFRQHRPVLAYEEPFSPYFDASMVWGPITGRMIYLGLRLKINRYE